MSEFTIFDVEFPANARQRVIINTDAKNECDDQFAIVHGILTPSFELHGIIPAHFGTRKSETSLQDSVDETNLLLDLMELKDQIRVEPGAVHAMPDETTPIDSPGARLIIEEAMKDDDRPLYIAFYGPVTDISSALLLEPAIENRNIVVLWIGGGDWPAGGREYNLSNDIHAANVLMKSKLQLWQIPRTAYRTMSVTYAEMIEKCTPCGPIGEYLTRQVIEHNQASQPHMEYRSLGDSPCIGLILDPVSGEWDWRPAPLFDDRMKYVHTGQYRPIRVYSRVNTRFIHEDLWAKLGLCDG